MKVLLVGDSPLAGELAALCASAGHPPLHIAGGEQGDFRLDNGQMGGEMLAIEVIDDDLAAKQSVIRRLDALLPPDVLLLTAALNVGATEAAAWCRQSGRVVGFAAIPPFSSATVVELLPALQSVPAMIEKAQSFWRSIGREPVTIADSVGGVLPRVVCNLINEAAYALMEGVATPADIDRAMQLGTNHPRGPLAWADLIGIPQVVAILEALGREFGADQYHPAPLLKQYARAGRTFYA